MHRPQSYVSNVLPAIRCWMSALVGHIILYDNTPLSNGYLVVISFNRTIAELIVRESIFNLTNIAEGNFFLDRK